MTFLDTTYIPRAAVQPRPVLMRRDARPWPRGFGMLFAAIASALLWWAIVHAALILL
jgi:hypothetical protein